MQTSSLQSRPLAELGVRKPAHIDAVDWSLLGEHEARRLRELGFDEGVTIELLHAAPLGGDPIACRVGRMTVALRRRQAAAISVIPTAP